jgi:hypothetical protein
MVARYAYLMPRRPNRTNVNLGARVSKATKERALAAARSLDKSVGEYVTDLIENGPVRNDLNHRVVLAREVTPIARAAAFVLRALDEAKRSNMAPAIEELQQMRQLLVRSLALMRPTLDQRIDEIPRANDIWSGDAD